MKEEIQQLLLDSKTVQAKQLIFSILGQSKNQAEEVELYLLLGSTYAMESNNELAIQYFNKAYSIAPTNYDVVLAIANFFIANGSNTEAKQLMDNYLSQITNQADTVETDNMKQEETEKEFDYMDFILGGGDALNYEYKKDSDSSKAPSYKKHKPASQPNNPSVYQDLILNDNINDILNKHNLLPIDTQRKANFEAEISTKTAPAEAVTNANHLDGKPNLLFTMYGWNESGGGTSLPKTLAKEFAKRGYKVAVFYATAQHNTIKTPYFMEKTIDDGVKLYGIYNRPTVFADVDNPAREICDENIITLWKEVIEEVKPDIINFHNFLGLSFEMATVAKQKNIVSTFTTHNYHLLDPKLYLINNDLTNWTNTNFFENSDLVERFPHLKNDFIKRFDKARSLISNEIDYVFAVSKRVKELLSDFLDNSDIATNKICVINQLNSSVQQFIEQPVKQHTLTENVRFAFIGTGLPYKGAHIIAQALQFIKNKNFTIDFWGEYSDDYAKAIKSIDKLDVISFKGSYIAEDLRKIAENTDLMLFASLGEDCAPMVLAESLAMKLPVIAAKIGGVEDFIIDGYNGCLYEPGNPKALASVIQMALENPFKIKHWKNNCKLPYTFYDYIKHLESIYTRLKQGEHPSTEECNLLFAENLLTKNC